MVTNLIAVTALALVCVVWGLARRTNDDAGSCDGAGGCGACGGDRDCER